MKKKITALALTLAMAIFAGCRTQQTQLEQISLEQAKTAALADSGLKSDQVVFTTGQLSEKDGKAYYDIHFTSGEKEYNYNIDALTGVVITAQAPEKADDNPVQSSTPAASPAPQSDASEQIGEEKAKEIAMEHAGVSAADVIFVKSGIDRDDGRLVYDVEFYSKEYKEYDYDIDAYTGEVLSFDHDAEYYKAQAGTSTGKSLTEAEAKALALEQVPGAVESDIWEFTTDYDDGRLEYEGKIVYNKMEYEFEIDGYSGAIRNWDVESIYDD